jgi:predicted Ser/Thr protein kinase
MSSECPTCGAPIPHDSPLGLCPRCLLRQAPVTQSIERQEDRSSSNHSRFSPPTVEELAPHFPQLEILELIGQGGMGAVYRARQPGLDRMVALKILAMDTREDPSFAERFAREARVLARLNHPHVVNVYDSGQTGPFCYLLMEFVQGVNLREVMNEGSLRPAEALAIIPQICDALQYAHEEGVVHRDIKPENILLDRRGRVKVADFGLAKWVQPGQLDHSLTRTHQVMGTPRYMAPEQLEGAQNVDHRADIFSLGVVLYELLTGELPIGRFAPPSQRAEIDARLDEVVMRTLEKEPDRRYQHASDVKTDIESIGSVSVASPSGDRFGFEYRSRAELFGVPWIHVASGWDPQTGRPRCARGIIAVGPRALGGLAIGGAATGVFAMGGLSIGFFSLGGCALGILLAIGGCAIGTGISAGGMALGPIALGGCAVGIVAAGGAAFGLIRIGGNVPGGQSMLNSEWIADRLGWLPPFHGPLPSEVQHPPLPVPPAMGMPTLGLLFLLALLGLAALAFFAVIVAGVVTALQARRPVHEEPSQEFTEKDISPRGYRPPVILKKELEEPREYVSTTTSDSPQDHHRLAILGILGGALVLSMLIRQGGGIFLPGIETPLIPAVLLLGLVGFAIWSAVQSRGCAIALGLFVTAVVLLGLIGGMFFVSHTATRVYDTPPEAIPAWEMDFIVPMPEIREETDQLEKGDDEVNGGDDVPDQETEENSEEPGLAREGE